MRRLPRQASRSVRMGSTFAALAAGFDAPGTAETPEQALQAIIANGKTRARVLICGSLYLAGEILRENG